MSEQPGSDSSASGKNLLCRLRLHKWDYVNPIRRRCQRCGYQQTFRLAAGVWREWRDEWQKAIEDKWRIERDE